MEPSERKDEADEVEVDEVDGPDAETAGEQADDGDEVEGFLLKSGNLLGTTPVYRQLPPDKQHQIAHDT